MKKEFTIKITFEEDGQHIADILFSGKEGKLLDAPTFDIQLKRKRVSCLAASIATKLFNTLDDETRIAIRTASKPTARA
jgi:hypothetical protein